MLTGCRRNFRSTRTVYRPNAKENKNQTKREEVRRMVKEEIQHDLQEINDESIQEKPCCQQSRDFRKDYLAPIPNTCPYCAYACEQSWRPGSRLCYQNPLIYPPAVINDWYNCGMAVACPSIYPVINPCVYNTLEAPICKPSRYFCPSHHAVCHF